jgi:hypothetical protein
MEDNQQSRHSIEITDLSDVFIEISDIAFVFEM